MKLLNTLNLLTLQKVREIVKTVIQIGFFLKENINIFGFFAAKKKETLKNIMNRTPAALLDHEKLKKYA